MRPRILISGCDGSRENYENAVLLAGGEPYSYYLPQVSADYDGLILAGGGDMDPAHYGQENTASVGIDRQRDITELALTKAYLKAGKPVLGICRGHQVVNVALGGTLAQDLGRKLDLFHTQDGQGCDRIHPIRCIYGGQIHRLYGDHTQVNSAHHQFVSQPGHDLYVTAVTECGLIEATQHLTLPVVTVQWHPERMIGDARADGGKLFAWLVEQCKR